MLKTSLRTSTLARLDSTPVVMETHGGYGEIFKRCYRGVASGVVFEKKPNKAEILARQRPTWAVYEADCVKALGADAGGHLEINVLDVDPYGEPWPVLTAFFTSDRPRAQQMAVVVNDGLRQKVKMGGGWSTGSLKAVVSRYGNDKLYANYLDVCRELLEESVSQAGYGLTHWGGYYCGYAKQMTHYAALLELQ